MKITGEDLFKIWMAWPETEDRFVINYKTWWGDNRCLNVVEMKAYEIRCYTDKFRSTRRFINKTQGFEITEAGRFTTEAW